MNLHDKLIDDVAQKMYGRTYDALEYADKVFINAYIRDVIKPEWKPFTYDGKPTNYVVSNAGQVMNVVQNQKADIKENSNGVYVASLKIDGKWHQFPVHRMVATLFVDNPDNRPEVVHIKDFNWLNWYKNLKWMTREEMVINGIGNVGNRSSAKYNEDDVRKVVELAKTGLKVKQIAEEAKVSESFVIGILYRGEWKSITHNLGLPDIQKTTDSKVIHEICRQLEAGAQPGIIATELGVNQGVVYSIKTGKAHRFISNQYNIPGLEKDDSVSEKKIDKIFSLFDQGIDDTDTILEKMGLENTRGNRKYISKVRQKFRKLNK